MPAMSWANNVLPFAVTRARISLSGLAGGTYEWTRQTLLPRSRARRLGGQLKALETFLRQLLLLIALKLELAPLKPREALKPVAFGLSEDGVETVWFPRGPVRCLRLAPPSLPEDGLPDLPRTAPCKGPVPAGRFLDRIAAIHRVLVSPLAHVRRLARVLARQKGSLGIYCIVGAQVNRRRLDPELSHLARPLPGELISAIADWPDTG